MNLTQMQRSVLRMLDQLQTTDPFYTDNLFPAAGDESLSVINIAADQLLRQAIGNNGSNMMFFPELHTTFDLGPTVSGNNVIARPTNCIAVQKITSSRSTTLPSWPVTREYSVNYYEPYDFGLLTKDTTVRADWVRGYTLLGTSVLVYPTPDVNHIDYLRLYGLKGEPLLVTSATTTTFLMDPSWHPLIAKLAASLLASMKDEVDKSVRWHGEVMTELQTRLNVTAAQTTRGGAAVANMPSRGSVYGYGWGDGGD